MDYDWVGPSKGAFNDSANWENGDGVHGVPDASDDVGVYGTAKKRVTITGSGQVATLYAEDLTIAGSIDAASVQLTGAIIVDTGGGLVTDDVLLNYDSSFTIGGFVTTYGNVVEAYTSPVTIGVSTGEADGMGWTVKSFFEDEEGLLTVEHAASFSVSALDESDGLDLSDTKARLVVTSEGTLTTAGLVSQNGAHVTIEDFGRVQATGSKFNDANGPFGSQFTADGLLSADFDGPTTINNAEFVGDGSIVIGYQTLDDAGSPNSVSVTASGSANVTDSFTLIADGRLSLSGKTVWTAGDGAAKASMKGSIQVGWFSNWAGSAASLSVSGSAALKGRELAIEADGRFSLSSSATVLLGSGAARTGAVAIGTGGVVTLDGRSGSYNAVTDIEGGSLDVEVAKAAGSAKATFESEGGAIDISEGASLGNTIAGFSAKASIDFLDLTTTSATFKNDVLTLKDGKKVVETLKFATSEHLIVSSDGKGGTKVTYGGKAGVTFESAKQEAVADSTGGAPWLADHISATAAGLANSADHASAGAGLGDYSRPAPLGDYALSGPQAAGETWSDAFS